MKGRGPLLTLLGSIYLEPNYAHLALLKSQQEEKKRHISLSLESQ